MGKDEGEEEWECKGVEVVEAIWAAEGVGAMVMAMVAVGERMGVEDIMVTTMVTTILLHPINYIRMTTMDLVRVGLVCIR